MNEGTSVWFQLVDNDGNPYMGTTEDEVEFTSSVNVAKFRRDVKRMYIDSHLKGVASSDLRVFRNKDAFDKRKSADGKEEPLKPSHSIEGLGRIEEEALYVVVPASALSGELRSIAEAKFPPFNPEKDYLFSYPLLQSVNGETYLPLLGREKVVQQINSNFDRVANSPKYNPIIISTSRGMGKTFLLKMIGMQKVKPELKCLKIEQARDCGRILALDFRLRATAIQSIEDVQSFFTRLMINHLSKLFDHKNVDGLNFYFLEFEKVETQHSDRNFNEWRKTCLGFGADSMMEEYVRLTNIAFFGSRTNCYCKVPPVFLLDEVQALCVKTEIRSKDDGSVHTWLSLLLTQLSGYNRPICICAGTNNGNILEITEKSTFIPVIISLSPLVDESDYMTYWAESTTHLNNGRSTPILMDGDGDKDLINALVYASYQIPRLLQIAHSTWYSSKTKAATNLEFILQQFELEATTYYQEMFSFLERYSVSDVSRVIMSCGVHWKVQDVHNDTVPGTTIKWSSLIKDSVVFPYLDNCYLFPFMIVWRDKLNTNDKRKAAIEQYCREDVKNLELQNLFYSYDNLCKADLYNLGIAYETLFVSSVAVKYRLWQLVHKNDNKLVLFSEIYDFGTESDETMTLMRFMMDLSHGIYYPTKEFCINNYTELPNAVIHNKDFHNAHHDIIIPSNDLVIPVSANASRYLSGESVLSKQLQTSKTSDEKVKMLVWLYLGNCKTEKKYSNVAFLDGSGVCNGMALDMLHLLKNLKSTNNKRSRRA